MSTWLRTRSCCIGRSRLSDQDAHTSLRRLLYLSMGHQLLAYQACRPAQGVLGAGPTWVPAQMQEAQDSLLPACQEWPGPQALHCTPPPSCTQKTQRVINSALCMHSWLWLLPLGSALPAAHHLIAPSALMVLAWCCSGSDTRLPSLKQPWIKLVCCVRPGTVPLGLLLA